MALKRPRVAIIFDSENKPAHKALHIAEITKCAKKHGDFVFKMAFGFASKEARQAYRQHKIIDCGRKRQIRQSTDERICNFAKENCASFDVLVIVSNDNDFAPLLASFRTMGKRAIVYGTKNVGQMLWRSSNECYTLTQGA